MARSLLFFFGRRALSRKEWLNLLCERRGLLWTDGEEELDLCSGWITRALTGPLDHWTAELPMDYHWLHRCECCEWVAQSSGGAPGGAQRRRAEIGWLACLLCYTSVTTYSLVLQRINKSILLCHHLLLLELTPLNFFEYFNGVEMIYMH